MKRTWMAVAVALLGLAAVACNTQPAGDGEGSLSGAIQIDGSSTVFPVTEAIAEEFRAEQPGVNVTVGQSGTGGGFEKFCNAETDISDASRPIADDEIEACDAEGIEYVELEVAIDGLSVLVNPANDFAECMTVDELKRAWEPDSEVTTWRDIRSEWPDEQIEFYGAGADSGTFDYFTDEIVGEEGAIRSDYTGSEDDNILVQGVAGEENALGFFGYAYYVQNTDKLKTVGVDGGDGCVAPTDETIEDGSYSPLSRPIFIYPRVDALARPEVRAFVEFYLDTVNDILGDVGYIPLTEADLQASKDALSEALPEGDEDGS